LGTKRVFGRKNLRTFGISVKYDPHREGTSVTHMHAGLPRGRSDEGCCVKRA
jgi:hypothetical protein